MSADDIDSQDQWPLPPVWMWDCADCARLYQSMKHTQEVVTELTLTGDRTVDWDFDDSMVGSQISLAQHLVKAHLDHLPDWDRQCAACGSHRDQVAREMRKGSAGAVVASVAAEHRARHLFVPPGIAGLM